MEFQTDGPLAKAASRVVILEVVEGDTKDPARGVTPQRRPPRLKVFLYDDWADACRNVAKDDLLSLTVPIQLVTAAEERDVGDLEQWVLFAPVAMVKRHSALLDGLGAKERARVGGCGALALKRVVERYEEMYGRLEKEEEEDAQASTVTSMEASKGVLRPTDSVTSSSAVAQRDGVVRPGDKTSFDPAVESEHKEEH